MPDNIKRPVNLADVQRRYQAFFDGLNHTEDMVCAISATSFVDGAVTSLLGNHFLESGWAEGLLKPVGGALGSIKAKADAAFCLGLISKGCKQNLERIGDIRNRFAHSIEDVSFSDGKVVEFCDGLTFPQVAAEFSTDPNATPGLFEKVATTPRAKFMVVSSTLFNSLVMSAMSVTRCTLKTDAWDQSTG
jgi:hypothetical protein